MPMLRRWAVAYAILSPRKQRQAWLILCILVLASFFELAGVVSVLPFLRALESPTAIETNGLMSAIYRLGDFGSYDALLMALGITAFTLLLMAALVRAITLYSLNGFIHSCRLDISCRLFSLYLHQPYIFFVTRHSGEMSNMVLSEVDLFVDSALTPMAQILSSFFVLTALLLLVIYMDPATAIGAMLVITAVYATIYWASRKRIARSGAERMAANRRRFEVAGEAFAGIKPIKMMGLESRYLERFWTASRIAARNIIFNTTVGQLPRIVVEATAFGGIILLALILTMRKQPGDAGVLAMLGLYAFAGYRILPALQNIYQNLNNMRFAAPVVDRLFADIRRCTNDMPGVASDDAPMLQTRLQLEHVDYSYPRRGTNDQWPAGISDISFDLAAGQSLGIIGATGAGKTTLVDVILGLLVHDGGAILVDGVAITDVNRAAWQRRIGYVPQDIYLSASSVAENIAFGLDWAAIDHDRVAQVARMAHIDDFIVTQLPQAYATQVGERGITLSGGQRQRVGIARALYHDPDLLVFDEATSALDNDTEAAVMDALTELAGKKTIIMIAHRLTTISRCDQVIRLDNGRMVDAGGQPAQRAIVRES